MKWKAYLLPSANCRKVMFLHLSVSHSVHSPLLPGRHHHPRQTPSPRRPLQRTVRILVECILVSRVHWAPLTNTTLTMILFVPQSPPCPENISELINSLQSCDLPSRCNPLLLMLASLLTYAVYSLYVHCKCPLMQKGWWFFNYLYFRGRLLVEQGGQGTGKTGNLVLTFSRQGKHRNFVLTQGKIC